MSEIEQQTGYVFLYNNEIVDVYREVDVQLENVSLEATLSQIFEDQEVSFVIKGKYVVFTPPGKTDEVDFGNDRHVSGRVTDEYGVPLPGVSVMIKGSDSGTITNPEGYYSIEIPAGEQVLLFSFVGMEDQEIRITGQRIQDVVLKETQIEIDEVVVVGYGTKKKSLVTGAISSVSQEDIITSTSSTMQSIQGKVSGVQVRPTSGAPGAAMSVIIRGAGSNGNAQPLYIVDGMITSPDYLSPSEIESIEVLKDAASSAIYGAEGANGVVLITTKTGERGASVIDYDFQYGVQSAPDMPRMMNVQEYSTYLAEAGVDDEIPDSVASTDWMDELFQTAPMQSHTLTISGGSQKSKYLVSGSYFGQDGIVGGAKSNYQRYSFRVNSDHQLREWLEVGNKLSYTSSERRTIAEDSEYDGLISSAIMMDPLTPVRYDSVPDNVQDALDNGHAPVMDENGKYYGMSQFTMGKVSNALALLETMKDEYSDDKLTGIFYTNVKPFKGFQFTSRLGLDISYGRSNSWNPRYYFTPDRMNDVPSVNQGVDSWRSWLWDNYMTYSSEFGQHHVSVMAGMSARKNSYEYVWGTAAPMAVEDDSYAFLDHVLSRENDKTGGSASQTALLSYFGRASYDFASKYLFEATLRRDGSSLFSPSNRFALFPSASVGWIISNEDFFKTGSLLNHLKLRGSWGQNGSLSNLSPDQWNSLISSDGIKYPHSGGGYYPGAEPVAIANKDLVWETSEQINIGFDLRMLQNKLSLVADYYNKKTIDLLTPATPPLSIGNSAPYANGGDVTNRGFEFELAYKNYDGDLKYRIGVNLSTLKNRVTYLNPLAGNGIYGTQVGRWIGATRFDVGYPIWYFRGYKTDGIFQNQEQIDQYIEENGLSRYNPSPGDPIVVDVDQDSLITADDRTYIGDPHPDAMFGASLYLEYKGFDINLFLQGSYGNEVLMGFYRNDYRYTNKPKFFYDDRWTGEGSTNEWFGADSRNQYIYQSDFMVQDGSFIRIRQIQLGYTLPEFVLDRAKISKLRLFVSLDNYFTFTKYKGIDPEAGSESGSSQGVDRGVYPVPRTMLFGLSLSL
ncbi:MAG: TonB-dependent receptor [Bacteroidota bacterium]